MICVNQYLFGVAIALAITWPILLVLFIYSANKWVDERKKTTTIAIAGGMIMRRNADKVFVHTHPDNCPDCQSINHYEELQNNGKD